MELMFKFKASALLIAGLIAAGFSAPAKANVVYDITFDNYGSTVEGTGTLTLNFPTLAADEGVNESLAGILVSIATSNLDGNGMFMITPTNLASGSQFQTGTLGQIYTLTAQESGSGASSVLFLDLYTSSWQLHNGNDEGATADQGSFTITGPFLAAATPLPATLPLFAGGLGFIGYLTKRRKRNAKQVLRTA
jgi:hypothetical protein